MNAARRDPARGGLALASLLALAAALGAAADPPGRIDERRIAGLDWTVLETADPVVDVVPHPAGGLALLTLDGPVDAEADEDPGRRLLRWHRGEVGVLLDGLLPGPPALFVRGPEVWWEEALDDGEARTRRLLPGRNEPAAAPADWIDLAAQARHGLLQAPARADVGRLDLLDEDLREHLRIPLPVEAERRGDALVLRSPPVTFLPGAPGASAAPLVTRPGHWVVGPRPVGDRRLRAWTLDPASGELSEAWCRLPGPEELGGHRVVQLAGRPALVAWTTSADRLGVFEKLGLRVWLLEPDRTRAGRPPVLATETETRRWFEPRVLTVDVDGDGREELVVGQPRGLGGGELVVDVYPVSDTGRLGEARSVDFDALGAEWELGDVDGDGVLDLVVLDSRRLTVRRGVAGHRRRAFEKRPGIEVELEALPRPAGATVAAGGGTVVTVGLGNAPRVEGSEEHEDRDAHELFLLDGDGDGRPEPVLVRTRGDRGSLVLALRIPPGA